MFAYKVIKSGRGFVKDLYDPEPCRNLDFDSTVVAMHYVYTSDEFKSGMWLIQDGTFSEGQSKYMMDFATEDNFATWLYHRCAGKVVKK